VSTVVHASGCVSLLLYVLLYGLDTYASRRLGQTPTSPTRSAGTLGVRWRPPLLVAMT
jgi:hypothetical protein